MGIFIGKSGQFLMIKRAGAHGTGSWSVPGGWMEFGEAFEQTAKREVAEEVGLKIKNVRFGGVSNTVFSDEEIHSVTVWVTSDYASGEEKNLEPEKISELKWCTFDSLPNPLFEPWNELLQSEFIDRIKHQLQNT